MSRSNIGKVRLNLTKMERLRAKKAHHIGNLYKQVVYLDQMISVYKEALSEEQGEQNAICGDAARETIGDAGNTTRESGGSVCAILQTDGGEVATESKLDDMEPNPPRSA